MIFLAVAWISWSCPGGWLSGLIPAPARPLLCQPVPAIALYDPARAAEARARVRQLGAPAQLYACRADRCSAPLVDWNLTPTFKDR